MIIANNIDDLYIDGLQHILDNGEYILPVDDPSPGFARQTKANGFIDAGPVVLKLSHPRNRIISVKPIDIFNIMGLFTWFVQGETSVNHIKFYNPLVSKFVDDDPEHLYGAWGSRVMPKLNTVLEMLKLSSSRRIYIPVYYPEDVGVPSLNLPCLIGIHLIRKGDKVDCIVNMRSSNAYNIFPYDVAVGSLVFEVITTLANLELGTFYFTANSYHIYEPYIDSAKQLVENPDLNNRYLSMPVMGNDVHNFLSLEHMIHNGISLDNLMLSSISTYWRDFLLVSYACRCRNEGTTISPELEKYISYKPFISLLNARLK